MGLMSGKKGIVFGVANDKSIAWGIARKLHQEGAALAFTYLNEVFEKRVRPLAESIGSELILRCDVTKDSEIEGVYSEIEQKWGSLDFVVHSVAYAGREELRQPFHQTSREGFRNSLDISAYSLIAVTRGALDEQDLQAARLLKQNERHGGGGALILGEEHRLVGGQTMLDVIEGHHLCTRTHSKEEKTPRPQDEGSIGAFSLFYHLPLKRQHLSGRQEPSR